MNKCYLCPNGCGSDRSLSFGRCNVGEKLKIARYGLHFYEEPPVSFKNGSGTVFFCGCPLKCVFCQNYPVSRNTVGKEITTQKLADIFKELEDKGAENINLVNPTHFLPEIAKAFDIYRPKIPVVYNTHSYEKVEQLEKFDEYVDIYLPDIKFFSPDISFRYTGRKDYFEYASTAVEFMAKKPLSFRDDGKMLSGTIVRHLIMPLCIPDSLNILEWFAPLKDKVFFSLMAQYTPCGEIDSFPELKRKITKREYGIVFDKLSELNITNAFCQSLSSGDKTYIPDWDF